MVSGFQLADFQAEYSSSAFFELTRSLITYYRGLPSVDGQREMQQ